MILYSISMSYYNTDDLEDIKMINYVDKEPSLIEYYRDDIKNSIKVVSKTGLIVLTEMINVMPTVIRLYSYYKFIKIFV
jgi:hypothetical protein